MIESRSTVSLADRSQARPRAESKAPIVWLKERLDAVLVAVVLIAALAARLWYAQGVSFPPLDDPAYYVKVAQNLFEGRGLTIGVVWNYFLPFTSATHPSNEFWMPFPSLLMYAAFRLLGTSFHVAQIPGVVSGTLVPPLTYLYGRRVFAEVGLPAARRAAFACALLLALNALLTYQSAAADSTAPYAFLVLCALLLAGRGTGEVSSLRHFLLGAVIGLAYLTRSHAIFLLGAWALFWLISLREAKGRSARLGRGLLTVVGAGVIIGPWLIRNYLAFGLFSSPSTYKSALVVDYLDFFNFATPVDLPTFLQHGFSSIAASKLAGLGHDLAVQNSTVLPLAAIAWVGLLWLVWSQPRARLGFLYAILLYVGMSLVFTGPALTGSYWHSLGSTLPAMYVGLVYPVARFCQWLRGRRCWRYDFFEFFWLGILAIVLAQLLIGGPGTAKRHREEAQQFGRIASWLGEHPASVVMTTQPSTLNYVTDIPAIMLPGNEQPSVVLDAAKRFGARYLIITEHYGLYPAVLEERADNRFIEVSRTKDAVIYELHY